MKQFIPLILLVTTLSLKAQQWGWAMAPQSTVTGIAMDADLNGDIYYSAKGSFVRINNNNQTVWAKPINYSIADLTVNGNFLYVCGSFSGSATFSGSTLTSAGDSDGFVAKLDKNGNVIWLKQLSGQGANDIISLSVDNGGNLACLGRNYGASSFGNLTFNTGFALIKLDPSGNASASATITQQQYVSNGKIRSDNSGNFYALFTNYDTAFHINTTPQPGAYSHAYFHLAKFDGTGALTWSKTLTDCFRRHIADFFVNTDQTIYYSCAETYSDEKIYKLAANGSLLWSKECGSFLYGGTEKIEVDSLSNIYITGTTWNSAAFGNVSVTGNEMFMYVAKLDSTAQGIWALKGQASTESCGKQICVKGNNIAVAGYVREGSQLSLSNLSVQGHNFLARINTSQITGLETLELGNKIISPNPSNGIIYINNSEVCTARLTDLSGKLIYSATLNPSEPLKPNPALRGMYILTVEEKGKQYSRKIIFQ